jgi:hypothetical protein
VSRAGAVEPLGYAGREMANPTAAPVSLALAGLTLPEAGGPPVRLGSLWERTPAVVVFLRHYG